MGVDREAAGVTVVLSAAGVISLGEQLSHSLISLTHILSVTFIVITKNMCANLKRILRMCKFFFKKSTKK